MSKSIGQNILNWMRRHRLATGIIGIVLVILVLLALLSTLLVGSGTLKSSPSFSGSFDGLEEMSARQADVDTVSDTAAVNPAEQSGVQIQEGNVRIDSQDIDADEVRIRMLTEDYNGYIEEANQTDSNTRRRSNLTARVPASSFSTYLADIRTQFDVENYHIRDFRIEIQEKTTELDIIADTMARYAEMKQELAQMPVDAERINLTMDITDKELDLKRQENRLTQQLDRITRRGDMATLRITLDQRVSAEIWPEDIGNDIRDQLRSAVDDVVSIAIAILTSSLVVFMTAIQWAIYLFIVLIVLWFAYRFLRRLYNRWKK